MCELQNNCGFYIFLLATEKITRGLDCPKPNKYECPRYKVKIGQVKNSEAQTIYNVRGDIYRHELPISHDESNM